MEDGLVNCIRYYYTGYGPWVSLTSGFLPSLRDGVRSVSTQCSVGVLYRGVPKLVDEYPSKFLNLWIWHKLIPSPRYSSWSIYSSSLQRIDRLSDGGLRRSWTHSTGNESLRLDCLHRVPCQCLAGLRVCPIQRLLSSRCRAVAHALVS